MKRSWGLILLLICVGCSSALWGQIQQSQVVFGYIGLATDGTRSAPLLRDTELQLLENRIKGHLLEIARQENYSIATPKNSAQLSEYLRTNQNDRFRDELVGFGSNLTVNGLIFFRLESNGGFRFSAFLYASPSAELVAQSTETAPTFDILLEKIGTSIYSLFGLPLPEIAGRMASTSTTILGVGSFARNQNLQLSDVVGTWQGDYGIQRVEIRADGTGTAWLSESDNMKVKVNLSDQTITIKQDEPNAPKLYLSVFPYTIASQIVRLARPISWEFHITQEKDRLIGTKETSYFYIEQGKIIQVDNTYSRDAVWTRTP